MPRTQNETLALFRKLPAYTTISDYIRLAITVGDIYPVTTLRALLAMGRIPEFEAEYKPVLSEFIGAFSIKIDPLDGCKVGALVSGMLIVLSGCGYIVTKQQLAHNENFILLMWGILCNGQPEPEKIVSKNNSIMITNKDQTLRKIGGEDGEGMG